MSPARALMLQALRRRAAMQPPAVAQQIAQRLQLLEDAVNMSVADPSSAPAARAVSRPAKVPWPRGTPASAALASALRFQKVWARHHTLERIARADAQRPANAGPLNSHSLAVLTLQRLQQLPAGYLHRFIDHLEALQWLEAVAAAPAASPAAPRKAAQRAAGRAGPRRAR